MAKIILYYYLTPTFQQLKKVIIEAPLHKVLPFHSFTYIILYNYTTTVGLGIRHDANEIS
jgi:hypothetical protein